MVISRLVSSILSVPLSVIFGTTASTAHAMAAPDCAKQLSPTAPSVRASRNISEDDLLRLRDIGPRWRRDDEPISSLSPDGKMLAFILTRDDPNANAQCRALIALALDEPIAPRVIDIGGEAINPLLPIRGLMTGYGVPAINQPRWSPEGRWLAYLRRDDGQTRLWRARSDGSGASPVSRTTEDVDRFTWAADGTKLIFATKQFKAAERAIDQEGVAGYLYDRRTVPFAGMKPAIDAPTPEAFVTVDLEKGASRPSDPAEQSLLGPDPGILSGQSVLRADGPETKAWIAPDNPGAYQGVSHIWARMGLGDQPVRCPAPECVADVEHRILQIWWSGRDLLILERYGQNGDRTGLFRWSVTRQNLARLFYTTDELIGCLPRPGDMICGRESSLQPRQIISVSTANGAEKLLYDPNPEFSAIRLGVTRRLYWKNKFGLASFGDLVLPPGFERTGRLPLIVTQYDSRGFLRGGTGDEYPIQMFAAHGYAVLSLQRPPFVTAAQSHADWRSNAELKKSLYQNHAERESLLSFVEEGVRHAVDTGLIDPQRIGITGLSDGTSTVNFSLANTTLFAAAAISSAGGDSDLMIYGGPAVIEDRLRSGYPISTQTQTDFWKRASPAGNMDARPVPLLMQLSDHEALLGLQAYQSLLDRHWPVELYYYPDEYHIKTQPAHRKAIYERNLAWFDFWLKGKFAPDPGWAATFARWNKLSVASGIMPGNPTARPALHVAQRQ